MLISMAMHAGDVRPFVEVTAEDARKGLDISNIILESPLRIIQTFSLQPLVSVLVLRD